ncbi:hypothetical protein [Trichormus variabilis]|nr:hypothetical protein [Trichormus variabilis]
MVIPLVSGTGAVMNAYSERSDRKSSKPDDMASPCNIMSGSTPIVR